MEVISGLDGVLGERGRRGAQGGGRSIATHAMAEGGVGHQRDVVLGARGGDAVGQHVRAEEAQLDLDGVDLGERGGLVDGRGRHLAERDAAQQTLVDVLLHHPEGVGEGHVGVAAGALEQVELLAAVELLQDVVERAPDRLGRAVDALVADGALDAEDHLVGVLGVLGEVARHEGHGVARGRAVELAAVPEGHAVLDGGAHGREGLLVGRRLGPPG